MEVSAPLPLACQSRATPMLLQWPLVGSEGNQNGRQVMLHAGGQVSSINLLLRRRERNYGLPRHVHDQQTSIACQGILLLHPGRSVHCYMLCKHEYM